MQVLRTQSDYDIYTSIFHYLSQKDTEQVNINYSGNRTLSAYLLLVHQSSSSSFLAMAFFLASRASASPPAKLGVGVLLRLPSDPFMLIPESRAGNCGAAAGFLPAAGRLAGGVGFAAPLAPFAAGGGGGGLATAAGGGGGGACSSTYAAGTHAWPSGVFASHHPVHGSVSFCPSTPRSKTSHHYFPFEQSRLFAQP